MCQHMVQHRLLLWIIQRQLQLKGHDHIFHCLISIIIFYGISNTYNKKFECYKI